MYFEWPKLTVSGTLKLLWDKVHVLAWGHVCSVGPWSEAHGFLSEDHCKVVIMSAMNSVPAVSSARWLRLGYLTAFHISTALPLDGILGCRISEEGFMGRETKRSKISALSQWCPRGTLTLKFCNQDPISSPAPPGPPDETTQATQIT